MQGLVVVFLLCNLLSLSLVLPLHMSLISGLFYPSFLFHYLHAAQGLKGCICSQVFYAANKLVEIRDVTNYIF